MLWAITLPQTKAVVRLAHNNRTSPFSSGAFLLPIPLLEQARYPKARPWLMALPSQDQSSFTRSYLEGRDLQQQKHLWHRPERWKERGPGFRQNLADRESAEGKKHQIGKKKSIKQLKCLKEMNAARSHEGRATTFLFFKSCMWCPKRTLAILIRKGSRQTCVTPIQVDIS